MNSKNWVTLLFHIIICALGLTTCGERTPSDRQLSLDPKYLDVEDIRSFANCIGPNGNYTTEVISKKDGNLQFTQVFDYRDAPFKASIDATNRGYVIDENQQVIDTLSNAAIEMIRSHDFHRLHTSPESFFSQIKFASESNNQIQLFSAIDRLANPVKIYYDPTTRRIISIAFPNMMDTTEVIEVVYRKWTQSEYGDLVSELDVIQAKQDTFRFVFETVEINK